ncbi:hypothetical protein LTR78_007016 [Recurvomyces mirabilis]|uniref:Uncharacterized protein n=1 Tax=Recurvomyces mirabilis TaxID=574656 RepID=A0AAE1BZ84_9PEZI|nr:hypothetical protein LTR78_007016 [Recurvomyces mirabilis]KAK5153400.1 hypothetical protein LTS14_007569 [Recurvomyces mirabilis]
MQRLAGRLGLAITVKAKRMAASPERAVEENLGVWCAQASDNLRQEFLDCVKLVEAFGWSTDLDVSAVDEIETGMQMAERHYSLVEEQVLLLQETVIEQRLLLEELVDLLPMKMAVAGAVAIEASTEADLEQHSTSTWARVDAQARDLRKVREDALHRAAYGQAVEDFC